MITLPAISVDLAAGLDQVGSAPEGASELAASFAALLVGLQQQPQVAPQLASLVVSLPAADAPPVEAVTSPPQLLPVTGVPGASRRLADFPSSLSPRSVDRVLPAETAATPSVYVAAPQIAVDLANFGLKIRPTDDASPTLVTPEAPVVPAIDPSGVVDSAMLTVRVETAPVAPVGLPTTTGSAAPAQPQAVPESPVERIPTVQPVAVQSEPVARVATPEMQHSPSVTVVASTETDSVAAPAPPVDVTVPQTPTKLPVATMPLPATPALSVPAAPALAVPAAAAATPAETLPAVPAQTVAVPQHDLPAAASAPIVVAASAKAVIKPVTAETSADEGPDAPAQPADPAATERPLLAPAAPQTLASSSMPTAASVDAPPNVSPAAPASAVREAAATPTDSAPPTVTHLRVELAPPLLGDVVLELRHERDTITASALVDRPATAETLRLVQAQVQQVLADQGIAVGSFEVSCRDDRQARDDSAPGQGFAPQQRESQTSAEPRRAISAGPSSTLVDLYA